MINTTRIEACAALRQGFVIHLHCVADRACKDVLFAEQIEGAGIGLVGIFDVVLKRIIQHHWAGDRAALNQNAALIVGKATIVYVERCASGVNGIFAVVGKGEI